MCCFEWSAAQRGLAAARRMYVAMAWRPGTDEELIYAHSIRSMLYVKVAVRDGAAIGRLWRPESRLALGETGPLRALLL